tara:strand:+ start:267 stop:1064 length:798 start_codon:yes stop_codon:yes gene_type:complete
MGFILSCATTPTRIDKLIQIISRLKCKYKYFVINICNKYKRFGEFKIPKSLLMLCKSDKRIVFQFVDDYGPICKYIGGFKFMRKKQLYNDNLIIIDDDICYHKDLFYELMDDKNDKNITTGSGFNYTKDRNYIVVLGECEMIEGYGGVCFDYFQWEGFLNWYVEFYKHFDFKSDNIIDKYLCASFLGDDYILSNIYKNKFAIKSGRQYIKPYDYGYNDDALQKNTIFNGNMGSYLFLHENNKILETFKLKKLLNTEITSSLEYKN